MSWHFLQEQEVASWADTCLDGAPDALLKLIPTPALSCSHDSETASFRDFQCGMTLQRSMGSPGAATSMLCQADSLARTSATADINWASKANEADSGEKCPGSLAKYDRATSSWRTSQRCFIEGWARFSEIWPRWGLMRDGVCWDAQISAARNPENASGLWPTLKASDGDQYSRNFAYFERRQKVAPDLPVMVALKTPPTEAGFYGRLNPDWCEWLMGFPVGWTKLGSLEMDRFLSWLQQHGIYSGTEGSKNGGNGNG